MDRFGRYTVTGTLGSGAMGEVYAAVDDVLGRDVAVKTLRGRASGLAARLADERFRLEARAIASLAHPGVVQVYDIDLAAEPPYLVMERVAGPSLRDRIAAGPLAAGELRALGIQIARALAAAHAAGIVHRDVKPSNILAAGPGTWKLADFGVAHVPDSSLTWTGQFVGSPAYAPPEALVRGQTGPAGDVFGLGATLYQAAAGRWPRSEATTGALLAPIPSLRTLAPELPDDVIAAIDRALAIEPEQRPSASELAEALAGAGAAAVALPAAAAQARRIPRRWLAAGAFAALIAIAIATRGSPGRDTPAAVSAPLAVPQAPPAPSDDEPPPEMPGEVHVVTPDGLDGKAARDWNRLVEHLVRQRFDEALDKLDEWERKHGERPETRRLRAQLDALPRELFRRRERGAD